MKLLETDPAELDKAYIWHPFTQMQDWLCADPIVIQSGKGAVLKDTKGRRYLDANASIWTNLHGHNHPKINRAIVAQLKKISHSSALGLANEPASFLAEKLIKALELREFKFPKSTNEARENSENRNHENHEDGEIFNHEMQFHRQPKLAKVFFSDDGSTAMETALKLHHQFIYHTRPQISPRYLSLEGSYHGDTLGSMSLGHSTLFHKPFEKIRFPVDRVMAPYCYRCPYNRAEATPADARHTRRCHWECIDQVKQKIEQAQNENKPYTAFVIEPLIQGAAGMIAHPKGYLAKLSTILRQYDLQLIADEVMTGLGRTGGFIACHQEGVVPDYLALAKGLTGGYLPMAATITTQEVFESFLGPYESFRSFFHGHSFTGNQLGSAAALANLSILQSESSNQKRKQLAQWLADALHRLWHLPQIGDIRQVGLIAGIELVADRATRKPYPLANQIGIKVCQAMSKRAVLTRPIGNVIVIMPIYCMSKRQLDTLFYTLTESIKEVL